jgi:hypothetical protein
VSLKKSTRLTERSILEFQADAFNVFNHADFDVPVNSTSLYSVSSSGLRKTAITPRDPSTTTLGLIQQTLGGPRILQLSMHLSF